jgi:hypothetical protein
VDIETIVSLLGAGSVIFSTFAAVVIWIIRLEGKVNTINAVSVERKQQQAALSNKIDSMSKNMEENFHRVFDKLDSKADK